MPTPQIIIVEYKSRVIRIIRAPALIAYRKATQTQTISGCGSIKNVKTGVIAGSMRFFWIK